MKLVKDFEESVHKLSGIVFIIEDNDDALGFLADRIDPRVWADFYESLRKIEQSLLADEGNGVKH